MDIQQTLVLIGLMGAGKTSIGRKLAKDLNIEFIDADTEVEKAAGYSIQEIFKIYGESEFRILEERVINRLLLSKQIVLATGGGAYINPRIRAPIKQSAFSIWLKASLDVLVDRTSRRTDRPLLNNGNSREILNELINKRYQIYSEADLTIETSTESVNETVNAIVIALEKAQVERMEIPKNE